MISIKIKKINSYFIALLVLIIIWHGGALLLNKPFLPTPWSVLSQFCNILKSQYLLNHFFISFYRVVVSLLIAFITATPLGLLIGRVDSLDRIFSPLIYVLYPLPKVVFLPIIIVILGLGDLPKIFLVTLIVFFQIIVTARDAAKSISLEDIRSIKSLNASNWQVFYHLIWPFCLPKIFTSLRISLGTAIAVLFFAETFASTTGIGYFIFDAMEKRTYVAMYAGIISMGFLGLILYLVIDYLEWFFCRWQKY